MRLSEQRSSMLHGVLLMALQGSVAESNGRGYCLGHALCQQSAQQPA